MMCGAVWRGVTIVTLYFFTVVVVSSRMRWTQPSYNNLEFSTIVFENRLLILFSTDENLKGIVLQTLNVYNLQETNISLVLQVRYKHRITFY